MRKRTSILRPTGFLALATIALLLFIGVTGDSRRQTNAIERARSYAAELASRMGGGSRMPLNLSPNVLASHDADSIGMQWLSSANAYLLRPSGHRGMVAWTIPIVQAMGADGRAAIFFESGEFSVRWLTLHEFRRHESEQAALIEELSAMFDQSEP